LCAKDLRIQPGFHLTKLFTFLQFKNLDCIIENIKKTIAISYLLSKGVVVEFPGILVTDSVVVVVVTVVVVAG